MDLTGVKRVIVADDDNVVLAIAATMLADETQSVSAGLKYVLSEYHGLINLEIAHGVRLTGGHGTWPLVEGGCQTRKPSNL